MTDQKLLRVRSLLLLTYIHLIDGHTGSHCCTLQSLTKGGLKNVIMPGSAARGETLLEVPLESSTDTCSHPLLFQTDKTATCTTANLNKPDNLLTLDSQLSWDKKTRMAHSGNSIKMYCGRHDTSVDEAANDSLYQPHPQVLYK